MWLSRLDIARLRILGQVSLEPGPGLNLLIGRNGSGKSSVLEAVCMLGSGRSFRTRRLQELVQHGSESMSVFGQVAARDKRIETVGVSWEAGRRRVRVGGQDIAAASSLARQMPVMVVTPESQRLFGDGARARRQLLDWLLFHVERDYHLAMKRFRRGLAQRNALLRSGVGGRELDLWDAEVGAAGEAVDTLREAHVGDLVRQVGGMLAQIQCADLKLEFRRGWARGRRLAEVLRDGRSADRARGTTGSGPHRGDWVVRSGGAAAHSVLSRGEAKRAVVAFMLGHLALFVERRGECPVLLVDDLGSELDERGRGALLETVRKGGGQVFVTAVEQGLVSPERWESARVFHVEQGRIASMI